jgi:hypothetical protein
MKSCIIGSKANGEFCITCTRSEYIFTTEGATFLTTGEKENIPLGNSLEDIVDGGDKLGIDGGFKESGCGNIC